jgi:hypothetical protein
VIALFFVPLQPVIINSRITPIIYMGVLQERYKQYREPQKFIERGVYPYFRAITGK